VATTGRAASTPHDAPHDLAMLAHELRRRVAALRVVGESIGMLRAKGVDTTGMMDLLVGEIDELDALAREVLRERRPAEPASGGADMVAAVRAAARTVATARASPSGSTRRRRRWSPAPAPRCSARRSRTCSTMPPATAVATTSR
jgi:hypothetical protein